MTYLRQIELLLQTSKMKGFWMVPNHPDVICYVHKNNMLTIEKCYDNTFNMIINAHFIGDRILAMFGYKYDAENRKMRTCYIHVDEREPGEYSLDCQESELPYEGVYNYQR